MAPGNLITDWELHPMPAIVAGLAALLYIRGVVSLAERGRRRPPARHAAFAAAWVGGVLATQSGPAHHAHHRFSAHMVQHVLLGMLVPLLLVTAAPLTLALQTAPRRARHRLRRLLHSRTARTLVHPVTAWTLFGGGLVALYLTPLLDLTGRHNLLHLAVHGHMVAAGLLVLAPAVGLDPLPGRLPYPARLASLLLMVPTHALVALALLSTDTPVAPSTYPDIDDQRLAAAVFWGTGELITLAAAGMVLRQWWRAEQRAMTREARARPPATLN